MLLKRVFFFVFVLCVDCKAYSGSALCEDLFRAQELGQQNHFHSESIDWTKITRFRFIRGLIVKVVLKDGSYGIMRLRPGDPALMNGNDTVFETFASLLFKVMKPEIHTPLTSLTLSHGDIELIRKLATPEEGVRIEKLIPGRATLSRYHDTLVEGSVYLRASPYLRTMMTVSKSIFGIYYWLKDMSGDGKISPNVIAHARKNGYVMSLNDKWEKANDSVKVKVVADLSMIKGKQFTVEGLPNEIADLAIDAFLTSGEVDTYILGIQRILFNSMPESAKSKFADYWGLVSILGISDPHPGNWFVSEEGKLKIIDLAYRSEVFNLGIEYLDFEQHGLFDINVQIQADAIAPILAPYFSQELVTNLTSLNVKDLKMLAEQAGFAFTNRQLYGILGRRDKLLTYVK